MHQVYHDMMLKNLKCLPAEKAYEYEQNTDSQNF